jgi:hypothetical protein
MTQGELVPLVLHPVLSKNLLKLDSSNQPVDYDYDLPNEEFSSPAVHPPMLSLKLESCQGFIQSITMQASRDSPNTGVTVRNVLRTILEDVKKLTRKQEWATLSAKERAAINAAFRERRSTEEDLCGRDRLQILPTALPDGKMLPPKMMAEVLSSVLSY